MRFQTVLVLLFVAMFTLNSMVIACGDCTPEERAAEIAAAEKKKKEVAKDKAKVIVKKDKKKKEKVKKVTDKKKDKKKKVLGVVPPPPPTQVLGVVPPPPPTQVLGVVPPPPPTAIVFVPPPPPAASIVSPFTPIGVDIRELASGFVIEQCLNQLGGFKAQNNVAAAASPGVPLRVIDCVCCQNAVNILPDVYPQSCGQLDTDFPLVISEFDFCARCSDNDGCKKCFVSPDFGKTNADLSTIKECIVADTGVTPPNVLPTSSIVTVNEAGTTNTLASDLDVCPPPNPPCTITRGGQTITLG